MGINRLIDPIFQIVYRLFVLLFENKDDREANRIFSSKSRNKKSKYHEWWKNCFDLINNLKNDQITYGNILTFANDQGDDCTAGNLYYLDYLYFKESYKLTAIDLSK